MAQTVVFNTLRAEKPLLFSDALDMLFYGNPMHYAKDSRSFVDLLDQIPKINDEFICLAFWRNGQFIEALRLESGQFQSGNASPFAKQEYDFAFNRSGGDLTIFVPRGNRDFSACHCVYRFKKSDSKDSQDGYEREMYLFELIGDVYVACIPGGAFGDSFLAVSTFIPEVGEDDFS